MNNKKLFLIGMPGSGKSTLGKKLAGSLGVPFYDLDTAIEEDQSMKVSEIFSKKGELFFREVESALLQKFARQSSEFVLATGGGAPCYHNGIFIINENGLSIFLDVTIDTLLLRLQKENHRPLLEDEDRKVRLTALLEERLPVYRKAHIHINNERDSLDDILIKIKSASNSRS